jgi:hypothetical protein
MMAGMITLILIGLLRGKDPPRLGPRKPRAAAPTGRPPAFRAAPTPAAVRPAVLGPAVPPVERLVGWRLHYSTRHRHSLAAVRLQDLLDLEEPPERARPSGCRPGDPSDRWGSATSSDRRSGDRFQRSQLLARLTWQDPELERKRQQATTELAEREATQRLREAAVAQTRGSSTSASQPLAAWRRLRPTSW